MPTKAPRTPRYCLQKSTGRAYVRVGGQWFTLGRYGSKASRAEYDRIVGEWLSSGRRLTPRSDDPNGPTIVELIAAFWTHVKEYYSTSSAEIDHFRGALRPVRRLYGNTPACEFGPLALKTIRREMIEAARSRNYINDQVARIKAMFKWAVGEELLHPSVYQALQAVPGLRRGRSAARETEPVRPVPVEHVEAIMPHVSPQVRALIRLQLLCGARPDELIRLRPVDIDMSGRVWEYRPTAHKTAHHGCKRLIYFGPKAQAAIEPFLSGRPVDAFVFSPRDAVGVRALSAETHRRPDQRPNVRKSDRRVGDRYTTESYRRAIHRACDLAKIPRWSPNRLRHNAATELRRQHGIDVAQTILGHQLGSAITEVYAEANQSKAREIVAKIG